ncbi:MAG: hypothetical protein WBA77_14320 [Microcoleaceae cyanobacterium]
MTMIPQISQANQPHPNHESDYSLSQPTQDPETHPVLGSLQQRHWLELAELVSLISSALGSVVVALSGQAIYGVAPVTVALSFNAANRYRLGQQVEQNQAQMIDVEQSIEQLEYNAVKVILGLRQQLIHEVESLQNQLEEIPRQAALESAYTSKEVAVLRDSVATMQDHLTTAIHDLKYQFKQELNEHLTLNSAQPESLQTRMAALEAVIEQLRNNTLTVEQHYRLNQLFEENQTVIKPHLKRLILVVRQLQDMKVKELPLPPKPMSSPTQRSDEIYQKYLS